MDKSAIDQLLAFDDDDDDEEESEEDDSEVREQAEILTDGWNAHCFKEIYPHASSLLCSDNADLARSFSPAVLRWR